LPVETSIIHGFMATIDIDQSVLLQIILLFLIFSGPCVIMNKATLTTHPSVMAHHLGKHEISVDGFFV
jgi:hypothetical protein